MASLNQNFTIYDLDKFAVKFTVSDADSALNAVGNKVWWGVAPANNSLPEAVVMQKSNGAWTQGGASNQVQNYGGVTVFPTSIEIEAALSNGSPGTYFTGSVNLTPPSYPGTYYHECVYSGDGDQEGSTVIANGTLTVEQSLFTESNFRV